MCNLGSIPIGRADEFATIFPQNRRLKWALLPLLLFVDPTHCKANVGVRRSPEVTL